MNLKWWHRIYEKDFTSKEIFKESFEHKIEKLTEDYEEIISLFNELENESYNSKLNQKALDQLEDLKDEYEKLINGNENLNNEYIKDENISLIFNYIDEVSEDVVITPFIITSDKKFMNYIMQN